LYGPYIQPFLTIHLSARNHHSNTGKHAEHEGLPYHLSVERATGAKRTAK